MKFSAGGAHISRTMMLAELEALLSAVPMRSDAAEYRDAILVRNVLGKTTDSTRQKSLRHLRELYALDERTPIFGALRKLYEIDPASLPQLAVQVAWVRDPLFRSTTPAITDAAVGDVVSPGALAEAVEVAFPDHYSELNRNKVARNAASSWTQSGHLVGRAGKVRRHVSVTPAAGALALFLGNVAGFYGSSVFSSPWCRLLDLSADRAKSIGSEAHRASLLNLRAIGEVVELTFPVLAEFQPLPA